ncbi:MAG TPA: alpha/beta fold hydrolase [Spirochaetota bacterium]|nr:alpha/beta fold hydrolase [Spirochaetota bacterium]OPZ35336.1 MAG: Alpha/beta hydrolase family protein [Spirochaetes bacterium ADurb.BinA120]HNU91560.1 alpha/beta fold hydrolase [Spirochaetota bacterium]HPI14611.1 alpha/beta fold hydrolase [Spirochaetota bacterium]HPO46240.1 alpha/beta fold hydrolase [Spirochaetota bacterium]
MNTDSMFNTGKGLKALLAFVALQLVFIGAVYTAHRIQTDSGSVEVSNVYFQNEDGNRIRGKLFRPVTATEADKHPGVLFIHGYQNNRESGDSYCIELGRRGFVTLSIDAIGRGNSDPPHDMDDPRFDKTFGARSSAKYLASLPFVDSRRVGVMGHSMGAEYSYWIALEDPSIRAVAIVGNAYDKRATRDRPKNMIMIIGEFDEFRDRFTATTNIMEQWMKTETTLNAFPVADPRFNTTYGDFAKGTARRVFVTRISHVQESHSRACIAEALDWMRLSLGPPESLWKDKNDQTWQIKEAMTLLAMLACFLSLLPLGLVLLRRPFFRPIRQGQAFGYACPEGKWWKYAAINGALMWLYLPLIMTLFAIHKFVVPVDRVFPMLLVDAIVWWFVIINLIGLMLLRRWYGKESSSGGLSWYDLGISHFRERWGLDGGRIGRTVLLGMLLFGFIYACEYTSERLALVDFRFIYPLLSDLTPYRVLMFALYFPFILFGFLVLTSFVHGQIRRAEKPSWWRTYGSWTGRNILALITPLFLFLLVQYVPLLTTGFIPFEGPGGVFVVFIIELFFIMLTLTIVMIQSTWFYQITGTIYLSALMNALVVTWLFASSQVIAPIP